MSTDEVSPLQLAMFGIVAIFQEHAGKGGDKFSLSKGELKELLKTQFKGLLDVCNDQKKLDETFNNLDLDSDNAVDFVEFMQIVTFMTIGLHEAFKPKAQ